MVYLIPIIFLISNIVEGLVRPILQQKANTPLWNCDRQGFLEIRGVKDAKGYRRRRTLLPVLWVNQVVVKSVLSMQMSPKPI